MLLLDGIQSLDDLELENQLVFLRTDLDSPLDKGGAVVERARIEAAVPTIKKLQEMGARVIVASRFGESKKGALKLRASNAPSIEPAAAYLSEVCQSDVLLPDACIGDSLKKVLLDLKSTQICCLENLIREEEGPLPSEAFARQLMSHVDIYVGDSLRALSLTSATTTDLPQLMEFRAAGLSLMKELQAVARIRSEIDGPRLVIWGGNALSARIDVLKRLSKTARHVLLVGVAANTMLKARGGQLGNSAVEESYLAGARTLHQQLGDKLILPEDLLCASSPKAEVATARPANSIPNDEMALDIGPRTRELIQKLVGEAGTAIWCGTVGFHKSRLFAEGTLALLNTFARSEAFTMVAGDDSVAAAHAVGTDTLDSIDCVALGGPATLALLDENKLAGLEALRGTTHD